VVTDQLGVNPLVAEKLSALFTSFGSDAIGLRQAFCSFVEKQRTARRIANSPFFSYNPRKSYVPVGLNLWEYGGSEAEFSRVLTKVTFCIIFKLIHLFASYFNL
jgi:hypothetical protein